MSKKSKKILLVRYGGANDVYQNNKRAPENKGLWVFVQDLWDKFYLTGTDKLYKDGRIKKKRIIDYKGNIWVGKYDIPKHMWKHILKESNRNDEEYGIWALIDWNTFIKVVNSHRYNHHKTKIDIIGINKVYEKIPDIKYVKPIDNYITYGQYRHYIECPKCGKYRLILETDKKYTKCPKCIREYEIPYNNMLEAFIPGSYENKTYRKEDKKDKKKNRKMYREIRKYKEMIT